MRTLPPLLAAALPVASLPVPQDDPGRVERVTREVLDRPEFRERRPSPFARALDWLLEQLARLLGSLAQGGSGTVIGVLLLVLILGGVAWLVWRFTRGVTPDAARGGGHGRAGRPATDWLADAATREAAGDWRQGLRCRYRALVADLAARGVVEEIPGTTAGEYRGQVARNVPGAAADFAGATELFELAWYGERPTGPDEAARFTGLAGRVLDQVPGGGSRDRATAAAGRGAAA